MQTLESSYQYLAQKCSQAKELVKPVVKLAAPVAHGALHLTAEAADLVSKSLLVAGPFASAILAIDSMNFLYGQSIFLNPCHKPTPFLLMHERFCDGITDQKMKNEAKMQLILSAAILTVGTPIAALTFHKISKLSTKLNQSF
jgi:hypothetical protein